MKYKQQKPPPTQAERTRAELAARRTYLKSDERREWEGRTIGAVRRLDAIAAKKRGAIQ